MGDPSLTLRMTANKDDSVNKEMNNMGKKKETAAEAAAEVIEGAESGLRSTEGGAQDDSVNADDSVNVGLIVNKSAAVPEMQGGRLALKAVYGATVYAQSRRIVGTGVFAEIPAGHVGLIMPAAALRDNYGIVCQGLRMPGDEGEISVTLINCGLRECNVQEGDVVAEMIVLPMVTE